MLEGTPVCLPEAIVPGGAEEISCPMMKRGGTRGPVSGGSAPIVCGCWDTQKSLMGR